MLVEKARKAQSEAWGLVRRPLPFSPRGSESAAVPVVGSASAVGTPTVAFRGAGAAGPGSRATGLAYER